MTNSATFIIGEAHFTHTTQDTDHGAPSSQRISLTASPRRCCRGRVGAERLVPNLPRSRGRSIGGDLDIGEEGSEQTIVTLQSLHHGSVGYQHTRALVGVTKKAKFLQMQLRTQARTRKNTTELQMNDYT
jgi:hypothetical protein